MKFPTVVRCLMGLVLPAQSPALNGTYTLVSGRSSEAIQAGIQRAVAHFGFHKRHIARYRLSQANRLHQSLSIRLGMEVLVASAWPSSPSNYGMGLKPLGTA